MISFYPGPSRVYDSVPAYVKDAHRTGILSMNHRSKGFMDLSRKTVALLKSKLKIPKDFTVFFTSSATECWEIIAQSLVTRQSIHLYNGAFGEKWYDYSKKLHPESTGIHFAIDAALDPSNLIFEKGEVICITQNETSNGTQVSNPMIAAIKENNPRHLIAVDATSSMGGVKLEYSAADIWLASVQKCFGLPAGLGILVLSSKAIEKARSINETGHYNSLIRLAEMMAIWQTSCTPNVLAIYLLMRTLRDRPAIGVIQKELKSRADAWHTFLSGSIRMTPITANAVVRSQTVIAIKSNQEFIQKIKKAAAKSGFLLGEGYGALKKDTFRIANFPAIKRKEIQALMKFLTPYL